MGATIGPTSRNRTRGGGGAAGGRIDFLGLGGEADRILQLLAQDRG